MKKNGTIKMKKSFSFTYHLIELQIELEISESKNN